MPNVNLHFTIEESLHRRFLRFKSYHGGIAHMGRQAIEFYVSMREQEEREKVEFKEYQKAKGEKNDPA